MSPVGYHMNIFLIQKASQEIKLGMVYLYHKKLFNVYQNGMVKMVEQWIRKHKVVGFYPHMGQILVALF